MREQVQSEKCRSFSKLEHTISVASAGTPCVLSSLPVFDRPYALPSVRYTNPHTSPRTAAAAVATTAICWMPRDASRLSPRHRGYHYHHHHHLSRSCHCWQMASTTCAMHFDPGPFSSIDCQRLPRCHLSISFWVFLLVVFHLWVSTKFWEPGDS